MLVLVRTRWVSLLTMVVLRMDVNGGSMQAFEAGFVVVIEVIAIQQRKTRFFLPLFFSSLLSLVFSFKRRFFSCQQTRWVNIDRVLHLILSNVSFVRSFDIEWEHLTRRWCARMSSLLLLSSFWCCRRCWLSKAKKNVCWRKRVVILWMKRSIG